MQHKEGETPEKTVWLTVEEFYAGSDPVTGEEFHVPAGGSREISAEKAEQLKADFPDSGFEFSDERPEGVEEPEAVTPPTSVPPSEQPGETETEKGETEVTYDEPAAREYVEALDREGLEVVAAHLNVDPSEYTDDDALREALVEASKAAVAGTDEEQAPEKKTGKRGRRGK